MATFEDVWRRALLRMPGAPALLVRDWAQTAITQAAEARGWGHLRTELTLTTLASRSLTVGVTQNSTTITSAAGFVASDAGRQFKTSAATIPIYTIASVTNASAAVLDQAYTGTTDAAVTATILDQYYTCPADFGRWLIILDPTYQRVIPFWHSQDELAVTDPARRTSDTGARFLVAQGYSTATATLGRVRYEWWPGVTSAKQYPSIYYKKQPELADTDSLPGVWSNRRDLFVLGTQREAALWPGTPDKRNPYFSLPLAAKLEADWQTQLQKASLDDDNQYPEDLLLVHWSRRYGGIAPTSQLLRQTDATVNDYF